MEGVQLYGVQPGLRHALQAAAAHGRPHRGEALPM